MIITKHDPLCLPVSNVVFQNLTKKMDIWQIPRVRVYVCGCLIANGWIGLAIQSDKEWINNVASWLAVWLPGWLASIASSTHELLQPEWKLKHRYSDRDIIKQNHAILDYCSKKGRHEMTTAKQSWILDTKLLLLRRFKTGFISFIRRRFSLLIFNLRSIDLQILK